MHLCEIILKYEELFYLKYPKFIEKLLSSLNKLIGNYQQGPTQLKTLFNIIGVIYKWFIRHREGKV